MDNHVPRSILETLEIVSNEQGQHDIGKITNLNSLRGIENGSLHFITVPRDQEFIDHSLLNPEYLAQFPNGFIVDLIPNGDGEQPTQQIITDSDGTELAFHSGGSGDEQDRRLTAALLQLVNKPCHIKIGNETQVIVANKDLTLAEETRQSSSNNIPASNDDYILSSDSIEDGQFRVYQHSKSNQIHMQTNPPLPPLTPIRRLVRQRKNSIVSQQAPSDIQIFQVNEINLEDDIDNRQRPLTKKSLPHKKRISKKLKTIDRVEPSPPIRQTVIYQDIQSNQVADESEFLAQQRPHQQRPHQQRPHQQLQTQQQQQQQPQFACELCSEICSSQLEFFAHLKAHYEPERMVPKAEKNEEIIIVNEPTANVENPPENQIIFNSFQHPAIEEVKVEQQSIPVLKESCSSQSRDSSVAQQRDDLHIEEAEFSDTEDMLEGIRGVVDKVQESVENDSNDGNDWYRSGSSMTENISYKTEENNQNLNSSVDFSMFFKNNLEKGGENQGIILPVEENEAKLVEEAPPSPTIILPRQTYETITEATNAISPSQPADLQSTDSADMCEILVIDQEEIYDDEKLPAILSKTRLSAAAQEPKADRTSPIKMSHRKRKVKIMQRIIDDEFSDLEGNGDDDDDEDGDRTDGDKSKSQRRKCLQCDKIFNSSNAFKYHELSHTGERPHQCETCGKSFFAQSALKVHMRLHSGDKPYECEICKRAFRQWGDLKYHTISIHTKERNFQCEFCGKAFARRYSLVIHRRIHTCEKNYKCDFCPKSFRASSYLQNHRKVHTGEKPYTCPICGKKFRVSGDLKRHQNIHGREKKKKSDSGSHATKIAVGSSTIKSDSTVLIDLNLLPEEVDLL